MDSYGLIWTPSKSKKIFYSLPLRKTSILSSYGLLWAHMDSNGFKANERISTSHEKHWHIKLIWTLMVSYGLLWAQSKLIVFNITGESMACKAQMDSYGLIWTRMG